MNRPSAAVMSLTPKQMGLLRYIGGLAGDRVVVSHEHMRAWMGIRAKSGISRLLAGLEERGRIRRGRRRPFTLEIRVPWNARAEPEIVPYEAPAPSYGTAYLPFFGRHMPQGSHCPPTACRDPYPFHDHKRCSEWGEA